ncbi:MAG TPA: hypothetical protein DHW82_05885 [Spirochaetia bacterium]|nr:MAG: hypothetical protein A2Y41_02280 [Spirochaetes bacterium GWB1_36_13]HCL56523.1 hypothetical protein [Spirochaetia bacterium]
MNKVFILFIFFLSTGCLSIGSSHDEPDPTPIIESVVIYETPNGDNIIDYSNDREDSAKILINGKNFIDLSIKLIHIEKGYEISPYKIDLINSSQVICNISNWEIMNGTGVWLIRAKNFNSEGWSTENVTITIY